MATPGNFDTYNRYRRDLSKCGELLTHEEENALFEQYRLSPTRDVFEKLCKHNLWFVVSVAKKYARYVQTTAITFEDLISEGNIGLIKAIDKYDHTKGFKFISYAVWQIMAEITTCLRNFSRSIRVPANEQQLLRKIIKEYDYMVQRDNMEVDRSDLLERLKSERIVPDSYELIDLEFIMNFKDAINMSAFKSDGNEDFKFEDTVADEDSNADSLVLNNEHMEVLSLALDKLPSRVASIFRSYYGLDGSEPKTAKTIAQEHDLSNEAIFLTMRKYMRQIKRDVDLNDHYYDTTTNDEDRKIAEKKLAPVENIRSNGKSRRKPVAYGGPVYTTY